MYKTDITIIGAGAVGVALARELSKYDLKVMVVDKNDDVGGVASKSCSGLISTSATMAPGTLENHLRMYGHAQFFNVCRDLDIPIDHCGAMSPILYPDQVDTVRTLLERAFQNGIYDYEYIPKEEALELEPSLNPDILGSIYAPRDSQINQFMLVIAEAENAAENGVEFLLDAEVTGIETDNGRIVRVNTVKGDIETKWVVNAAGMHCDDIAKMIGECDFEIHNRKGEFFVLDRSTPVKVSHIISSVPSPKTRGVLVVPTVDGNLLVGPTADDVDDKEDRKTTRKGMDAVREQALHMIPGLHFEDTITQFVGPRACCAPEGYCIRVNEKTRGYVGISGVRSTGVTASLGIAKYITHEMHEAGLELHRKSGWKRTRKGIVSFADKSDAEKDALIAENPLYGKIICRCEQITEAEIVEAIRRPVGAKSLDAIKRRVRAGMGRCQSGFCGPQVIEILARELGVSEYEIRKRGGASFMLDHDHE